MLNIIFNLTEFVWRLMIYFYYAIKEGTPVYKLYNNLAAALKDQLPISRFLRNLYKGHHLGLISRWSHLKKDGQPKIQYPKKSSALRAAESMKKKHKVHFSTYKCIWCDGYHIGKHTWVNNFEELKK